MSAWLKRFGLHLAAAVGATGIFFAAAAVGANQTRQQVAAVGTAEVAIPRTRTPGAQSKPSVVVAAPSPSAAPAPASAASPTKVVPERSLAGTVQDVLPDAIDVMGVGGRSWRVVPAPGALIRLNGRAAHLDALKAGDTVVILGQAQLKQNFLAHAITARRK